MKLSIQKSQLKQNDHLADRAMRVIGAAYKIPLIPVPDSDPSKIAGSIIASGVKQIISRITDAITACLDFPIDWKNTAVILTRQVTVISDR